MRKCVAHDDQRDQIKPPEAGDSIKPPEAGDSIKPPEAGDSIKRKCETIVKTNWPQEPKRRGNDAAAKHQHML